LTVMNLKFRHKASLLLTFFSWMRRSFIKTKFRHLCHG
jgi:hypothetical protein